MTHPSEAKIFRCDSSTAVTPGSMGSPPRSRLQAMRVFLKLLSNRPEKILPGSLIDVGARGSGPAMAEKRNAASDTVRAIGPITESVSHALADGQPGTRPGVGRKPTTLQ